MKDYRPLRTGFTTGACSAAAARAALTALIRQEDVARIAIVLPNGRNVEFPLLFCRHSLEEAIAGVVKDAGDDPDVTHQAEIHVRVSWCGDPGIHFRRGPGVGLVTKKGLPVPPGEPAINPGPRKLIAENLQPLLEEAGRTGVVVEISVPNGEKLAQKTFNPRLGIEGGISILGTTGIVVPYSHSAWLASVHQAIDVACAYGCQHLVFTVGERSERAARQMFPSCRAEAFIQIGPFFADALRYAASKGVARITLAAMIGKLAKFAAGAESVHSSSSRQDFDFLAAVGVGAGLPNDLVERVKVCTTAAEVSQLVADNKRFFEVLCDKARAVGRSFLPATCELQVVLLKNPAAI
ncbi:MAG: cobalt-precorrin-5B C(1)-methyltransferase [Gemmatales bacterium]|nr:MAG: cobalt-precorrin-5B C(1)-methyltransferase [Gemmatales bacterium]